MTTQQWIETLNRLYLNDTGAYLTWTLRRAEDTAQAYRTATTELQDALNTMQAQFPAEYFDIIRAAQSFTPEPLTPADVSWDDGGAHHGRAPLHTGYAYCTQAEYDRLTTEPHEDDTCYCHLPQCDGAHRDGQLRMNRAGSWVATPEPNEDDVLGLTCLSCGRTIGIDDARPNSTCIHCTPELPEDDMTSEYYDAEREGRSRIIPNPTSAKRAPSWDRRPNAPTPEQRPRWLARLNTVSVAALFLALTIQAPAGCTIVGTVPGDEAFPLAHCSDGAYLYADMDGSATHDRGAWVDAAGYIFVATR